MERIRRRLIGSMGLVLVAPALVRAQARMRRVGVVQFRGGLMNREGAHGVAFVAAMRELGYREGIEYVFDERLWQRQEEVPELVRQLVRLKTDVIIAAAPPSIVGARVATKEVPIVMMYAAEPVAMGLVKSLSKPGGNITGLTWDHGFETILKVLEVLREALPRVRRFAVMWDGTDSVHPVYAEYFAKGASETGMRMVSIELRRVADLEPEFARMRAEKVGAMIVLPSGQITIPNRRTIMALASRDGLPTLVNIIDDREWPGAFLRYGPNLSNSPRRAAAYVDRIFRGAKPAEMPVEQPDKYDFIVDLAAARELGLKLPASLIARADRVIE
jgi:putative tryptophan/tyrosine transport system substrate-binding protein